MKKSKGPLYIFYRSQPKAVLLAIEQYKKLRDLLEDYFDSLRIQEHEKSAKGKVAWDSLDDLKKELSL